MIVAGVLVCPAYRLQLAGLFTQSGFNSRGGDLTIRNPRVLTGDPTHPWADPHPEWQKSVIAFIGKERHETLFHRWRDLTEAGAVMAEDRLGQLKPGYAADLAILSENILAPGYNPDKLAWVKACLTVMNGHVTHEDFSSQPTTIDFAK